MQAHHNQLCNLLDSLMEDPYVSEHAGSPHYLDGKHYSLIFDSLLICFDLANSPTSLPEPTSEGELEDNEMRSSHFGGKHDFYDFYFPFLKKKKPLSA